MTREEFQTAMKRGAERREIAMHYFPSNSGEVSVARLRRWIAADPQLRAAIRRAGYRRRCHRFTGGVIRTFVDFFGYESF